MRHVLRGAGIATVGALVASAGCTFTEDFDQFTKGTGGSGGQAISAGGSAGSAGAAGGAAGTAGASGGGGVGGAIVGQGDPCTEANSRSCATHAGKSILACDASTLTWKLAVVCSGAQLCDSSDGANSGSCQDPIPACLGKSSGDIVCDGASRIVCGIDLVTSTKLGDCKDAVHCAMSVGQTCAACIPGEHECMGKDLYSCNAAHDGFDMVKSCASVPLCDAKGGVCTAPTCVAKTFSCAGDKLQMCKDDETGLSDVLMCSAGQCDAKAGKCDACAPGTTSCMDAKTLVACTADGTSMTTTVCKGTTPVCAGTPAACAQCGAPSDCPAPATPCKAATCTAGVCGTVAVGAGMAAPNQTAGDCQKIVCDDKGNTTSTADNTDVPADDKNPCTDDVCAAGKPTHPAKGDGLSCTGGACSAGKCVAGASCLGLPATCGPMKTESCCASLPVAGGTFGRSWDPSGASAGINGFTMSSNDRPATVTTYSLDKYEVTVGRFRAFVKAFPASTPLIGAGAKMSGGTGYPGWQSSFDGSLPADSAGYSTILKSCLQPSFLTWTDTPGGEETAPINCVTWFDAAAFCAWDGGRLPTEAEWNYAAAGGTDQRAYPWSTPASDLTLDSTHASYSDSPASCTGDAMAGCLVSDLAKVGSFPAGQGKFGHLDLAGNVQEWVIDTASTISSYPAGPCIDCALYDAAVNFNVVRGGAFDSAASLLRTAYRISYDPGLRKPQFGIRCVH